ncbi:hypothetical protein CASFOL_013544 [Castilleja foliolosa]|uniref:Peptidase A1 domain-containing protein n=1 Tax=Castilleja foliolosa TaxID=1961234 RepID=A0ABD3DP67_9LAMI
MSVLLLLLLSLLFSSSNLFLLSSAHSITLSLSRVAPPPSPAGNQWDNLKYHAASSLARAQFIKNPKTQLYPSSYGEYTVTLGFGTPPQKLSFIMDTGSSLVWFPCTHNYTCINCNISKADPTFIPKSSSSYKIVSCNSPQCRWLFPSFKCKNHTLPCGYLYGYGSGNTTGLLLSESLTIPGLPVANFIAGCSVFSADLPPGGIVGFGRDPESLPAQLGLKAFSYCLISHGFDDNTTASSDLVLMTTTPGGCKRPSANIQYTEFLSNTAFPDFYYVWLQNISIGGVHVNVPDKYMVPNTKGNGGTMVDSGTTFTLMAIWSSKNSISKLGKNTLEPEILNKKTVWSRVIMFVLIIRIK